MIRLCVEASGNLCPHHTIYATSPSGLHYCPIAVEKTSVNLTACLSFISTHVAIAVNPVHIRPQQKEDTTQCTIKSFAKFYRPSCFKNKSKYMYTTHL